MIDLLGAETGPAYQTLGHVDALPTGTMLGEFEIQGLLGFGGFGMVYRGYDHSLQRAVAIKEYMPSALVARGNNQELSVRSSGDEQTYHAGLKSFIAEARLLARFDHPSLVKVYRFWEANNTAYMAMPLYHGITLKQARLQMSGPPPEEWLRVIMWSVLEALKVLHSGEALHRDVSPDNIFLQDQGPPVLLDLGAARLAVMEGNKKHTAVLKVSYAPIEQYADLSDMREGPWTDVYALAAVIHGCICNEAPLPATFRVVRDRLPSLSKIAKTTEAHFGHSYSPAFVKAMDRALAIQPNDRPQSAEAFARELKLRSVSQAHRFDWRAALGDKVTLSSVTGGAGSISIGNASEDDSSAFAETRISEVTGPAEPKAAKAPIAKAKDPNARWWAMGLAAGAFILVAGVGWNSFLGSKSPIPAVAAVQVPAAVPAPAISAVAALPLAAASEAVALAAEQAASQPVVVTPVAEIAVETPPQIAPPMAAPKVQPSASTKPGKPSTTSSKTTDNRKNQTAKQVQDAAPVVVPVPVSRVEPSELPRPAEIPKPKPSGQVLCADSNLFTRPMCIYQECQKPEYKALQVCIDDRKRWEERDKANRP